MNIRKNGDVIKCEEGERGMERGLTDSHLMYKLDFYSHAEQGIFEKINVEA